jgi:hypothetical protein
MPGDTNNPVRAYGAAQRDMERLIDIFKGEMDRHAEGHRDAPRDWGRVGDLRNARQQLCRAIEAISGMGPADIERALRP